MQKNIFYTLWFVVPLSFLCRQEQGLGNFICITWVPWFLLHQGFVGRASHGVTPLRQGFVVQAGVLLVPCGAMDTRRCGYDGGR